MAFTRFGRSNEWSFCTTERPIFSTPSRIPSLAFFHCVFRQLLNSIVYLAACSFYRVSRHSLVPSAREIGVRYGCSQANPLLYVVLRLLSFDVIQGTHLITLKIQRSRNLVLLLHRQSPGRYMYHACRPLIL